MIELKVQKPYININGVVIDALEKHYAEDENGKRYKIKHDKSGKIMNQFICISPCKYTYSVTDELADGGAL